MGPYPSHHFLWRHVGCEEGGQQKTCQKNCDAAPKVEEGKSSPNIEMKKERENERRGLSYLLQTHDSTDSLKKARTKLREQAPASGDNLEQSFFRFCSNKWTF